MPPTTGPDPSPRMRVLTEFRVADGGRDDPAGTSVWAKAPPLVIAADASAETALQAAIANGVQHLTGNEACVIGRDHPEGVHQMRVALRRLRSRLSIYAGLLPDDQRRHADLGLKWLIGRLGPARDWDVYLSEVLDPVVRGLGAEGELGALRDVAHDRQDRAYERAAKALTADRYAALKRWLADWSGTRGWFAAGYPDEAWGVLLAPARDLAALVLAERHGEVRSRGEALGTMRAEDRHALRIRVKALRYAVEFFAPLYSDNAVGPYLAGLRGLQDSLGQMNDLVVARALMAGLVAKAAKRDRPALALAAGQVLGWHARSHDADGHANGAWHRFTTAEPFWG